VALDGKASYRMPSDTDGVPRKRIARAVVRNRGSTAAAGRKPVDINTNGDDLAQPYPV